jgi:hypothetical protein
LIELSVAVFLALIVVLALGKIFTMNQRAWEWGRQKVVLQQNGTEAVEWIARSVRAARTLEVVSPSELKTYDENGAIVHTFRRELVSGSYRLQQDGSDLVERPCTAFLVTPDPESTSVSLEVELEDGAGNRVRVMTRATLRNRSYEF